MKLSALLLLCFLVLGAANDLDDALAALRRGDFPAAEQKLRVLTAAQPGNALALSLLAAALDSQQKIAVADAVHRRAIALAPRSAEILNNYAVHLWMSGHESEARNIYFRIVAIEPSHPGANLQLAQLEIKAGNGAKALEYLARVPENPQSLLLRLNALCLNGNADDADALAARLTEFAKGNKELNVAIGTTLWNAHRFAAAETAFEAALQSDPANFNLLYDLGAAAAQAGHPARAAEVLESALLQHPGNVEVLLALAQADEALHRPEPALQLLAKASRLAPQRADVQKLIAATADGIGALDDALAAWNRYLALQPNDETAQRERAYTMAKMGKLDEALPFLESSVAKHPSDAAAHYELGQMQRGSDSTKAFAQFDKALQLDPKYVPALAARGSLYYQEGRPGLAAKDLEIAAALSPDAVNLDRLGQTYQALDKTSDAVRVLRQAADLAPADSKILLHYGRALADAGQTAESKAIMDRFRQLGPEKKAGVPPGFVEYLSLSPDERRASYRGRVEKAVHGHPGDAAIQLAWLKVLLEERHLTQAGEVADRIAALRPAAPIVAEAELDLALATLRAGKPSDALAELENIPAVARTPDYLMTRAEALGALGRQADSQAAATEAVASASSQPGLYRRAAGLLIAQSKPAEAAAILARAPQDRDILLMQAALANNPVHFVEIQNRWPEWYPGWAGQGIVLAEQGQCTTARKPLETAVALGAHEPEVYFYLAECQMKEGLPAQSTIDRAVALSGDHPDEWIQALAKGSKQIRPPYLNRLTEGTLFQDAAADKRR